MFKLEKKKILAVLLALSVLVLSSCTDGETETETGSNTDTAAVTESSGSDASGMEGSDTDIGTDSAVDEATGDVSAE